MCNGSGLHYGVNGSTITYTCHFKFQGLHAVPITWEGPGVRDAVSNDSKVDHTYLTLDCYQGNH